MALPYRAITPDACVNVDARRPKLPGCAREKCGPRKYVPGTAFLARYTRPERVMSCRVSVTRVDRPQAGSSQAGSLWRALLVEPGADLDRLRIDFLMWSDADLYEAIYQALLCQGPWAFRERETLVACTPAHWAVLSWFPRRQGASQAAARLPPRRS